MSSVFELLRLFFFLAGWHIRESQFKKSFSEVIVNNKTLPIVFEETVSFAQEVFIF